jgi:hypothetical protein
MVRTTRSLITSVVVVALALAGCSGDDPRPDRPAPTTGPAPLIGPGPVLRTYHQNMAFPTSEEIDAAERGVKVVLTFRVSPDATAAGEHDDQLREALAAMEEAGGEWFVGYFHEPEVRLSPQEYRAAFRRIARIVRASPTVRSIAVLMAYTFTERNPDDWYPGDDAVDVLGIDGYDWLGCIANGGDARTGAFARDFGDIFGPAVDYAEARGKPWIAAEFGRANDPSEPDARIGWLEDAAAWMREHPSMIGGAYFQHSVADGYRCNWALDEREREIAAALWPS